jgi:hypothetical protein
MNWLQTNYSTKSIFDGGIANCERLRAGVVGHPTEIPHERSMTGDQAPGGVFMITFLFIAVLAVLGFLAFTSPDGVAGPRHRH